MPTISTDVWITREGQQLDIKSMASSHLLSTIHFIERNRYNNAFSVAKETGFTEDAADMLNYYMQWPIQYNNLVAEAQRRGLIYRGVEGMKQKRIK